MWLSILAVSGGAVIGANLRWALSLWLNNSSHAVPYGTLAANLTGGWLAGLLIGKEEQNGAPPAYLNYLFFDKEMNYKYGGFKQMTEAAYEDGTDRAHERLYREVVAKEPGYFYIYPD
jgi:hypothetical protein